MENANSVVWAVINSNTGTVRTVKNTRSAARDAKRENERVVRYVADFTARA